MKPITKGTLLIITSAFFYASYGIWSRLMSHSFGDFSQAWSRGLILLIVILLINLKNPIFKPIKPGDWKWFLMIAFAGGLNQPLIFYGFRLLPIGTATLFFYAGIIIGGYALGKIVFNEKLTTIKLTSLALSLVGMVILYGISLGNSQLLPTLAIFTAGLMGGVAGVLPKKLSGQYQELHIMSGYFIVMIIANSMFAMLTHQALPSLENTSAWLGQLGYALAMLLANYTVIEGFKHIEASLGSLIGLVEIVFGVVFGMLLFGEALTPNIVVGGLLITLSATLPNLKK